MKWPETVIDTPAGPKSAIAPLVISASRATDISAFHAQWFMNRLRAGYCLWQNPFNAAQRQYISFEKCAAIVFWSKDARPLLPHLGEIEARGIRFYFQYTLNDYEREGLEPGLPPLSERIATFRQLSERVGRQRVIWRFDPIVMGAGLGVETVLARMRQLATALAPYTEKLVFSFLDMYKKTQRNLGSLDASLRAPTGPEACQIAEGIAEINAALPRPLRLATCAEELDLQRFGVEKNSCIDFGLLCRLCPENENIQRIYGASATQKQGSLLTPPGRSGRPVKDTGQRKACGCAPAKDIGSYNTCLHLCAYCYANSSKAAVLREMGSRDSNSERL
ncbi:MAG: DUF1848 domain-containing protein [Desulfovibrio sp.]|nr:DUF1848 domain-containing protein [Desulfovibrio sp.]